MWLIQGNHGCMENHVEKLHDDVDAVRYVLYLGGRLNAGGGCEAAVISRNILGLGETL